MLLSPKLHFLSQTRKLCTILNGFIKLIGKLPYFLADSLSGKILMAWYKSQLAQNSSTWQYHVCFPCCVHTYIVCTLSTSAGVYLVFVYLWHHSPNHTSAHSHELTIQSAVERWHCIILPNAMRNVTDAILASAAQHFLSVPFTLYWFG